MIRATLAAVTANVHIPDRERRPSFFATSHPSLMLRCRVGQVGGRCKKIATIIMPLLKLCEDADSGTGETKL